MNEIGVFAQDSWRLTPTFTLNYGLRWELQLPFAAAHDTCSTSTLADLCGLSGLGDGPDGRGCNLFKPGVAATGTVPQYVQYDQGNPGYDTDWNNFAPNVGVAWRPNVQGGWLRTLLGDPEQATVRGGYSWRSTASAWTRSPALRRQPGRAPIDATRNTATGHTRVLPGESWPVLFRETARLGAAAVPGRPAYPIAVAHRRQRRQHLRSGHPDAVHALVVGRLPALARHDMAVEVRYVGNRNMNGWTTENWNDENIFENGFLDEFKLAQANLRGQRRRRLRRPTFLLVTYRGAGTGTSPLPTYLAYFSARPGGAGRRPGALHVDELHEHAVDRPPRPVRAGSARRRQRPARQRDVPHQRDRRRAAGELLRDEPGRRRRQHHARRGAARATTRCSSTSAAGSRTGLLGNATTPSPGRYGPISTAVCAATALYPPDDDGRAARDQDEVDLRDPGRPRQALRQRHEPVAERRHRQLGVLGHRPRAGPRASAEQRASWSACRGRAAERLQDPHGATTRRGAAARCSACRRTSSTTRAARSTPTRPRRPATARDGVPTGRYIAPASAPGCIAVYAGDCGTPRNIYVRGPLFTRFDMRFKKRFPFGRKASFELQLELLNVFDNINFNHDVQRRRRRRQHRFQVTSGLHGHQHDVRSGRADRAAGVAG